MTHPSTSLFFFFCFRLESTEFLHNQYHHSCYRLYSVICCGFLNLTDTYYFYWEKNRKKIWYPLIWQYWVKKKKQKTHIENICCPPVQTMRGLRRQNLRASKPLQKVFLQENFETELLHLFAQSCVGFSYIICSFSGTVLLLCVCGSKAAVIPSYYLLFCSLRNSSNLLCSNLCQFFKNCTLASVIQ